MRKSFAFATATALALVTAATTAQAASDAWDGSTDGTWATSANWLTDPLTVPGTGDTATFNGAGNGFTTIDLGSGVTISNVLFDTASVAAYTIGSGAVGSQTLTLQTNGGITLSSTVANSQVLNANIALPATGVYNFANHSAASTLTIAGTNTTTSTGIKVMKVDGTGSTTISGPMVAGTGTLNLEKTNTGTLTLSGGASWSGNGVNAVLPGSGFLPVLLRAGTTIITGGNYTNAGEFALGGVITHGGAGNNAKLTMTGGQLVVTGSGTGGNWFSIGKGNGVGTVSSDVVLSNNASIITANSSLGWNAGNAANLPKGSLTLNDNASYTGNGNFYIGENSGSDMTVTVNGSTGVTNLNAAGIQVSRNGKGTLAINGGTVVTEGDLILNFDASGETNSSRVVLNGGNLHVAGSTPTSTAERWLIVKRTGNASAELVISNGTIHLNNQTDLRFSTQNAAATGTNTVTIWGGAITGYSDRATTVGGNVQIDMQRSGGAATVNTFNLNGGVVTVRDVVSTATSGTRAFNFNGGTLRPNASTTTFVNLGAGSARANVRNGGAIINTDGKDITIPQLLVHSDILGDNTIDGGLTKISTGALTLPNGSSYTGPTTVRGGTLNLNPSAASYANYSALTVSNATLALNVTGGSSSITADTVTLQNNAVLNLTYGTIGGNPGTPAIVSSGALSAPGTGIVINFSGTGFGIGSFKVIDYTGSALANVANFSVVTPPGVVAIVSNNVAETSVDVLITSVGQLLTWHGADSLNSPLTTWDINTSSNWNSGLAKYLEYGSYGDLVTFNDSALDPNVVLNTTVVPAQVVVDNATLSYNISGSGAISGAATITKNNTGTLALHTANSHTGGTIINGGTLTITNNNALGSAAAPVVLGGGTLQAATSLASSRSVSVTAASSLEVVPGTTTTLNGAVTASAALTKTGAGTLTVAGGSTNTGAMLIDAGVVNLTANYTNTSFITVGNAAGDSVLNLSGTVAANHLYVGNLSGAHSAVRQTSGTASFFNSAGDKLNLGQSGSYGYYNAQGGTLNVDGIALGGSVFPTEWPPQGTGDGLLEVTGGTINNIGWITMSRGGSGNKSVINVSSGSLSFGGGGIGCNWQLTGNDQTSIINLLGGSITSTNQGVDFRTANTGILNLNGGLLQASAVTGLGNVGFSGGTLRAALASANFLNVSQVTVYSGGATIDDAGFVLTVNQSLSAPTGYGVSSIGLTDGGSGYIAPPIVTIAGGSGSNATAIATVSGGAVTGIAITSPGTGYDVSDVLSVSFTGGGASAVAPTVNSVSLAANVTTGGFTKIGGGTLNLRGANNYGGATRVHSGKLVITPAHQTTGPVTVSNATTFAVSLPTTNGTATIGALTLTAGATTLEFNFGTNQNSATPILTAGAFTNLGTCTVRMTGPFAVGVVPLLDYTGSIQGGGTITTLIQAPQGVVATVSNSVANSMLYAVITEVGAGLVWRGTNIANPTAWDIGSTVNWTLGANPTIYTDGDTVIFNDLGSATVNLTNTVSPVSMLISNSAVSYTFQGAGNISGTTSLRKEGPGTATMGFTGNTYSGNTVVSNGILRLGSGTAIPEGVTAGGVSIGASGKLDVAGFSETINGLSGSGVIDNSSGTASTLTVGNGNGGGTWSGTITNSTGIVTVIKTGTGSLNISGTNYLGGTSQFNGGTNYLTSTGRIEPIGTGEFWVQQNAGSSTFIVDGGSLSVNNWFVVARNAAAANGTFILNSGTVQKTGGNHFVVGSIGAQGTLIVNGGQILNNGNLWLGEVGAANAVTANATLHLNGGLVQATQVRPNGAVVSSVAYFNGGTLQASASSADFISISTSALIQSGGLVLDSQAFVVTNASPLVEDGASPGGGLTKLGSGTLALTGGNSYSGLTTVSNGTLQVDGSIAGAVTVKSGAMLGGNGTINGVVTVEAGGKLAAGSSIGGLILNTSPSLGGSVVAEIDRNGGTPLADLITVSGLPVAYGGTLVITNTGADLQVGDTFTLFNASSYSGSFTLVSQTPNQIVTWNTSQLTVSGQISVATVAPAVNTTPGTLYSVVTGNTLNLTWTPDRLGWTLQTNSVSVVSPGDWHPVAGSASVTNVSLNIDASKTNVFFRLVYP